ncbi:MAG: FimV/HubP family polar landmark protein, partial [Mariprofundaceae bacterium]
MGRQIMHVLCTVVFVMISWVNVAQAVSLGKVDVASHLGETFYAEVGLGLEKGEVISSVFVELASPADYRILEVFRDKSLNAIRTDVKSDSRGSRVELTSSSVIESPFFNLVIKVRHGRATHFKKYAVFLDLPRSAKAPVNATIPSEKQQAPVEVVAELVEPASESAFKAYDGWARTGQYGPMVFGDTITTVAQRLRVDERYSNKQIMVALFEKNKAKFGQNNINLIKAGTFLDVPTADEVEQVSRQRARDVLKEHNRKWRELTKQSKYAKVKSAQENRYSKRVHMGEQASGVAAAPLVDGASPAISPEPEVLAVKGRSAPQASEEPAAMMALKTENDSLQQRLLDMEAKLSKLIEQPNASEVLAASESRIKKLELQLARQSNELEKARQQVSSDGSLNLLTWLLIGVITLLTLIAVYLAFALRGQRQMPSELKEEVVAEEQQPEALEEADSSESEVAESNSPVEADTVDILDDAIPDLTDEETSEMEAFQEPTEEADPNVDYLSEADVYMRYGMEDEAEKQVKMALRMREDNKDAHVKLVQMRHARGDQAGVEDAANVARGVLQGGALA